MLERTKPRAALGSMMLVPLGPETAGDLAADVWGTAGKLARKALHRQASFAHQAAHAATSESRLEFRPRRDGNSQRNWLSEPR